MDEIFKVNPPHKKNPETAKGFSQQLNPQARGAQRFKPVVAQLKTATNAPNASRAVAPTAYKPQSKPMVAQAKTPNLIQAKSRPAAPPVYRPQPVPKVLQTKMRNGQQGGIMNAPTAPPSTPRPSALPPGNRGAVQAKVSANAIGARSHAQTSARVVPPAPRAKGVLKPPPTPAGKNVINRSTPPRAGRSNHSRIVIQRSQSIKERYDQFAEKREWMQNTEARFSTRDEETGSYPGQLSLDEIAGTAFSSMNSRATGAVAMINGNLYFAGQGGVAYKNLEAIRGIFTTQTCEAADQVVPSPNMHAEMIIIYYCLKNGIDPRNAAIGVKDKGCCRLCSAALGHFDIAYTRTERSPYEDMWVDPWITAGLASPFGEGSGVPREESKLLH